MSAKRAWRPLAEVATDIPFKKQKIEVDDMAPERFVPLQHTDEEVSEPR